MPRIPPEGRRFQKGVVQNPLGAGAHDPIKKALKKLTSKQLEEIVTQILLVNPADINEAVKKEPTILKTWAASMAQTGIKKGDGTNLKTLIEMIHGRPKQRMELAGLDGGPIETSVETDEERKARKDRIAQLTGKLKELDSE